MSGLIAKYADAASRAFLEREGGHVPDFSTPYGEPALVGPDSVSWRVFKNPVTLFVGGVAAVILELAEPRVRTGVWANTDFRRDPVGRLRRTGMAAMVTVYGARSEAETMIARINRMHEKISGRTPSGAEFAASDRALLTWVQATAAYGFCEAYSAYVRELTPDDFDTFYTEGNGAAKLYGAVDAPATKAEQKALFDAWKPKLEPHDIVFEFLTLIRKMKALPPPANLAQSMFIRAAVEVVPSDIRNTLGLDGKYGLRIGERRLVQAVARYADGLCLVSAPPAQSCRRLGLPLNHLYRRR